jgi:fructose-specific component phosphotransferase system IIB-like protein
MNNNDTKAKFTATLVTENDKNAIVALRNETNLSEKELMTLVIQTALQHKDTILAQAKTLVEAYEVEKAARKKEAYEALKQKMQEARAAKKADKPKTDKPVKAPAKPAKSSKTVAVAA